MGTVYEGHFDKTKQQFHKYIIYAFVIIAAVFLISYFAFFRILISTNTTYMKNNVTQFMNSVDDIELITSSLAGQIFFDEDIQLINNKSLSDDELRIIHNRLAHYKKSDVYIESINVYDIQNDYMYSSEYFIKQNIMSDEYDNIRAKKTLSYKYDDQNKRGLYSYQYRQYVYMPYIVEINYFLNKFDYSRNDDFIYMMYDLNNSVLINGIDNDELLQIVDEIVDEDRNNGYFVKEIRNKKKYIFWENTSEKIYICYTSYLNVIKNMLTFLIVACSLFVLFSVIVFFGFVKGVKSIRMFFGNLVVFERKFELIYKQKDEIDKLRFIKNSDFLSNEMLEKNISKYELDSKGLYNMLMLKIDNEHRFLENVQIKEQEAIKFSVVNVFEELVLEYSKVMSITNNNEIVFVYKNNDAIDIRQIIKEVQQIIKENVDISLSAFICTQSVSIKDYAKAYKTLQKLKEYRIYYGNECIVTDNEVITERKLINISRCWSELLAKFKEKKLDELEDTYLYIITKISDMPPKEFVMANKLLALELISAVKNTRIQISDDLNTFLENIDTMETKQEITDEFVKILKKSQGFKVEVIAIANQELVYQIVEYIEDNCYDCILCRESIAKKFDINVRKLDSVFKEVMFISITNYIKEYRLKKATEYLIETDCSVSEIAKMVGFTTDSHFVYTFRKKFGMTPVTYRTVNLEVN